MVAAGAEKEKVVDRTGIAHRMAADKIGAAAVADTAAGD